MDNQLRELHIDYEGKYRLSIELRPNSDDLVAFLHGWGRSKECFAGALSRNMRVWARLYDEASPVALYRSVQSLVTWSDSGKLLPLFKALPHKAYIYSANGKRRKDVVPKLSKSITYEVPASHALMTDSPDGFYVTVAKILQVA